MLIELALALILAKIMDEIFIRKRQPAVIGEILVGIFFSATVFLLPQNFIIGDYTFPINFEIYHPAFDFFAETGILMLLFLSGMETNLGDLQRAGKNGLLTGALGVLITFGLVYAFIYIFGDFTSHQSIVFATIFTATSVGVTVRTMMDLGFLNTKIGNTILTAAVADDIFGIVLVTVVLSMNEIVPLLVGLAIFFVGIYLVYGFSLMDRAMEYTDRYLHTHYALVSIVIGIMFLFAFFADLVNIATITGTFFAGLFIGQSRTSRKIIEPIKLIGYSIFIPVFFVKVGTLVNFSNISSFNLVLLGVIPIVFAGKITGCFLGARMSGLPSRDSLMVGVGMVPEMEVALIIATLAYASGIFPEPMGTQVITITILYVIVSSLAVPLILRYLYRGKMHEGVS